MDEELKALARAALQDAFYDQFSALVSAFEKAAQGLENPHDPDRYTDKLQELASVYMIDRNVRPSRGPVVKAKIVGLGPHHVVRMESLAAALQNKNAMYIRVDGKQVFRRALDGEWVEA